MKFINSLTKLLKTLMIFMGADHGERGASSPPRIWSGGIVPPQILSCCKILCTRLLALQCRKMCFLLQQDFYSKSHHASPQNSSRIYAYDDFISWKV